LRSSVRPYPNKEVDSGLVPEDIDGNDLILQMRVKHPEGNWRISAFDPRLMVQRKPDEEGAEFYHVYPEGLIRKYDGEKVTLAKPLWGLDFNRNYPAHWAPEHLQKGAGPYPLSEPETRAVADYVMSHPNICIALSLHTTGEVALRPLSATDDSGLSQADLELYEMVADLAKVAEYDLVPVFGGLNKGTPSHGDFKDWAYDYLGILSLTIELWDVQVAAGITPRSWSDRQQIPEREWEKRQLALLAWNDKVHDGRFFVDWHYFTHPQLDQVEIGGWRRKEVLQNAPYEYREELCSRNLHFILGLASALPRLELIKKEIEEVEPGLWRFVVSLTNVGLLPTKVTDKAESIGVAEIEVSLSLPSNAVLIDGALVQKLGHLESKGIRRVSWLIKAELGSVIAIKASSSRAGRIEHVMQFAK
ncbi:MAG: M14 family zinc carboxypeptidase, partial [Bacillota bacterium]|nr:M14 family zinc carboxypeptidase [Bacillota bacterium]